MVEEYNLDTDVLIKRAWRNRAHIGGDGHWEVEVGDPEDQLINLETVGIKENSSARTCRQNAMFQSIIEQNLDQILGTEIHIRDPIDPTSRFRPGIIYDIGRMWLKILKKFLIPGTVLTAALAVQSDGDDHTGIICDPKNGLVKPSELPIYGGDECKSMDTSCQEPSPLEGTIGTVRKELWVWYDRYKGYRQKVIEVVQTGKAHTEATLDYLKEENNYLPRVGAISLGGIAGLVFGLRGGWTRRLTYASTGSITMAALCYPRHATDVSKEAISYVKKGFVITYNFIYGVKPEGLKLPLPPKLRDIKDEPKAATPQVEVDLQTVPDKLQSPDVIDSVMNDQSSPADIDLYTTRR